MGSARRGLRYPSEARMTLEHVVEPIKCGPSGGTKGPSSAAGLVTYDEQIARWFPWVVGADAERVVFPCRAPDDAGDFLYLDCGAWVGDADEEGARRDFALVAGGLVALCEFRSGDPVELLPASDDAARAINRALTALAGPQRCDVTVRRTARASTPPVGDDAPQVHLLLPDMHLPILTTLPELHPDLIPDPTKATCPCHGPIISRILYGSQQEAAAYRAVGASISRNPNDWIYMMAQSYESAAKDLVRLVDRVAKLGAAVHLVQLGGLFDLWDGYNCMFQGSGRMAWLRPEILRHVPEEDLPRALVGRDARHPHARGGPQGLAAPRRPPDAPVCRAHAPARRRRRQG